jgi:hypothetical protein
MSWWITNVLLEYYCLEIVLCLGVSDTEHLKLNTSDLVLIIDFTLITLSCSWLDQKNCFGEKWDYLITILFENIWIEKSVTKSTTKQSFVFKIDLMLYSVDVVQWSCLINNRSLWPFSKDTRIYVFPIKRTYLLMLEHSDKNVFSPEILYIPF